MTDPIIVPVSAPGASEAAGQVRTFAGTVAQTGAAAKEAATSQAGLAKATTAAGQAAEGAAVKNRAHIRTLDEEIARLKRLEEQTHITTAARKRLGESANASDIGAIRRFTRGLGGVGREIGRGVSEGVEGAEGSGLKATLGTAGAGMAAGFVAYEAIQHAVEKLVETMDEETAARFRGIRSLEEANKRISDIGKGALDKYGDALASIAAGGGEAAVGNAKAFAQKNKDATGIEAYDMASQHFAPGSERGLALQAAEMFHAAGGGSLKEGMSKLTPERISRMLAGGKGMSSMVGELFGDEHGRGRLLGPDVENRIANRAGSSTAASIDKLRGLENGTDLSGIDRIPAAEAPIRQARANAANPQAAILTEQDIAGRETYEKLQNRQEVEKAALQGLDTGNSTVGALARWGYTAARKLFGDGTANDQLDTAAKAKYETAEKVMPGTEEAAGHLRDMAESAQAAADALQRRGSGGHRGATP